MRLSRIFDGIRRRRTLRGASRQIADIKRSHIAELEAEILREYDSMRSAPPNERLSVQQTYEKMLPERRLLHLLRQEKLREKLTEAGIDVPERWTEPWEGDPKVLSMDGVRWAERQLRKFKEQRIEFWVKLVLPIFSLIVSIIALAISAHKK